MRRAPAFRSPARTPAPLTWFFDLDNTLHDASHQIFSAIDRSMNAYIVAELGLSADGANQLRRNYWVRYGATLSGLILHHGVNARDFLERSHAFVETDTFASMLRAERGIARLFARLPGRKILLTNAPARYAQRVLEEIGLHRQVRRRYAIEHMALHGRLRPKPSAASLRAILVRERVHPRHAILVEDSPINLRTARALGMRTVLVSGMTPAIGRKRNSRPPYVDVQVKSLRQLPQHHRHFR